MAARIIVTADNWRHENYVYILKLKGCIYLDKMGRKSKNRSVTSNIDIFEVFF